MISLHSKSISVTVHAVVMIMEMRLMDRGLRLRVLVLMVIASSFMASEENINIPVKVNRRLNGDIYYLNTIYYSCQTSRSYLVGEDRCVENQEFFTGKTWATICK